MHLYIVNYTTKMDLKRLRLQSCGIHGFLITLFFMALCIPQSDGITASACYGTDPDCDYYSLTCPENQLIKLGDMFAGRKIEMICTNASGHCSQRDLCCSRGENDTIEQFTEKNVYDTYNNCSGKRSCLSVQAPWQLLFSIAQTSTYVEINYNCVADNSAMKFCSMEARTNSYIELIFDGSTETFVSSDVGKDCRCEVSVTSSKSIKMMAIDVRMHSYHRNENGTQECSSATLRSSSWVQICVNVTDHYKSNFNNDLITEINVTPISPFEIKLEDLYQNGERDAPAMVWLAFEDESGGPFTLNCQPTETTTATTSTPSTPTTTEFSTLTKTPSPTPTTSTTPVTTTMTPTANLTTTTPTTSTSTMTTTTTPTQTTTTTESAPTTPTTTTITETTSELRTTPTTTTTPMTTTTTVTTSTITPTQTTIPTTTSPPTTIPTTTTSTTTVQTTSASTTIPMTSITPTTTSTTTSAPPTTSLPTTTATTSTTPTITSTTTTSTMTTTPTTTFTTTTTRTTPTTTSTEPIVITTPTVSPSPSPTTTAKLVTTTTTQRPITTTLTTTYLMTSMLSTTFSTTMSTTRTSTNPPSVTKKIFGDGVDDESQERAVILAIAIPVIVFAIAGVAFGIWFYGKRTSSYKPGKANHNGHVLTTAPIRHEHVHFVPFDDADL